MDWLKARTQVSERFEKYKYVLLIVAVGIVLMMLPGQSKSESKEAVPVNAPISESTEEQLEKILSQIRGVGKVQVMITEQTGAETVYQVDEDRTEGESSSVRTETVILSGSGVQTGLTKTVTPPTYLGAIVVCQGAKSPAIKLAVANAVAAVTGISLDRISVLEMK